MKARTTRALASHALAATAMSLPWPLLMVMVWHDTRSDVLLGVTGAARMAPYVALSWWVARLADRHRRDRLVRLTLGVRTLLLGGVAVALAAGRPGPGIAMATLAVAVATPAYPALAAGMPQLAGPASTRATDLLVTVEVSSFVVGPALGGLLLGAPALVGPVAVLMTAASCLLYTGVRQPRPVAVVPRPRRTGTATAWTTATTRRALTVLVVLNGVVAATGVTLLPLAEIRWEDWEWGHATAYGVLTGALGLGALGGPLLRGVGRTVGARMTVALGVVGGALACAGVAPAVGWAVPPLLLVGAAAVSAESAATTLLQESVPDCRRAGVLGMADSAMVTAAMVGALLAPPLANWWGARTVLAIVAICCGAVAQHERLRQVARAVVTRTSGPWRLAPYATTRPRSTTRVGVRSTVRSSRGSRW
jgi:MFS family permease